MRNCVELCSKLRALSSSSTDVFGWIINQDHHSKVVFKIPGLSTLHSCHNHYVPFKGKDVHGLMVRDNVYFVKPTADEESSCLGMSIIFDYFMLQWKKSLTKYVFF